jgi:hypothetical protein
MAPKTILKNNVNFQRGGQVFFQKQIGVWGIINQLTFSYLVGINEPFRYSHYYEKAYFY